MKRLYILFFILLLNSLLLNAQNKESEKKETSFLESININPHIGFSNILAETSPKVDDKYQEYMDELKKGMHYNINLSVSVYQNIGLTYHYCRFFSNNQSNELTIIMSDGEIRKGKIKENLAISYHGLSFNFLYPLKNNYNILSFDVGGGLLNYHKKAEIASPEIVNITGKTAGLYLGAKYEYRITNPLSLGFNVSSIIGSISNLENDGNLLEVDHTPENISRIDISFFLKIYPFEF